MRMCHIRIKNYYNKLNKLSSTRKLSQSGIKSAKHQLLQSINYERKYIIS